MVGFGLIRYSRPDGRKYDGDWFDGKQHGRGAFISANGRRKLAEWANGKRIRLLIDKDSGANTVPSRADKSPAEFLDLDPERSPSHLHEGSDKFV